MTRRARPDDDRPLQADVETLNGNRAWRIDTPGGAVLQKLYVERSGGLRGVLRDLLIAIAGTKTSARAKARRATERRLLAKWRGAGFDVPLDRTDEFPQFGGSNVAVFEFVNGQPLYDLLVSPQISPDTRASLLRRFAAEWGRRHVAAIAANDADLIQEHGSIRHVLVSDARMTTIDLEQAFLQRRDVRPLVAKEIAGYLRSHWKRVGEERFGSDLEAVLDGYPKPDILRDAADEYLRSASVLRRLIWSLDRIARRRRGGRDRAKYGPLELLHARLKARRAR